MNGKLSEFKKSYLNLPPLDKWIEYCKTENISEEEAISTHKKLLTDDVWLNDEYQVNINKTPHHGLGEFIIWHLSIKLITKEVIHDWRDLQEIKNMLVGKEYEAIELYPAESRRVDSANQYHLWVFVKDLEDNVDHPMIPVGWTERLVMNTPQMNAKQRKLEE